MDGDKITQDALLDDPGQPSGDEENPSPPPEEEELIPKSKVDKMLHDRHATLDKRIVSLEAQAKQHQARAEEYANQLKAQREAADRAEYEAVKDSPEALAAYKRAKDVERREAAAAEKERQIESSRQVHEEELRGVAEYKTLRKAEEIAKGYKDADPQTLIALTDGTPEKMTALAKVLWKAGEAPAKRTLVSQADKGLGGGLPGKLTPEQRERMSMEEYANHPSVKERFK